MENKQKRKRMKQIEKRMIDCFPDICFYYDSVHGTYDLNQTFGETITPLATSFGLMDFVNLPLADSIWINKLFITNEIDIHVYYVENYGKPNQSYQDHKSYPDWDDISTYEYPTERNIQYHKALDDMITKQQIKNHVM